jgi:hypothetical protein
MTNLTLPRGIRNNNPGNMRPLPNDRWRGEIPPDTGKTPDPHDEMGSYSRFETPEWGIRAMIRDIRKKRRRGLNTIQKIMDVYAPVGDDNDPKAYARQVCGRIGALLQIQIDPDDPLPPDSRAFRVAFAKAKVRVECGDPKPHARSEYWYADAVYERAAELEEAP